MKKNRPKPDVWQDVDDICFYINEFKEAVQFDDDDAYSFIQDHKLFSVITPIIAEGKHKEDPIANALIDYLETSQHYNTWIYQDPFKRNLLFIRCTENTNEKEYESEDKF